MESITALLKDAPPIIIMFVVMAWFFLQILDHFGKLPQPKNGNGNGYYLNGSGCRFSITNHEETSELIKQIHEDGIRRQEKDEQIVRALEKISDSVQRLHERGYRQ